MPEPSEQKEPQESPEKDPGFFKVYNYLLFTLSLPERTLRTTTGFVGGALRESAGLLVPQAFQNSKTYTIMIRQSLDFLTEDIGGVERKEGEDTPPQVENFVARKAVGNFIELAGLATLHLSPLTLLAVVSDLAYGSQTYLKELADELKKKGIIDEDSTINGVNDLLGAVSDASGVTASAFDTPPLSVEGLKETIDQTRESIQTMDPTKVIPQGELKRMWDEMHEIATRDGVSVMDVASTMTLHSLNKIADVGRGALTSVRVAGRLFDRLVLNHYAEALGDIKARGIYATMAETCEPYIGAVWSNFSTSKTTLTQDILSGRVFVKACRAIGRWFRRPKLEGKETTQQDPPEAQHE